MERADQDESSSCQATPVSPYWDAEDDDLDSEDYYPFDNSYHQQRAPAHHRAKRMEPCRFYNAGGCRNADNCPYMHVCRFSWIGSCRYGNSCRLRHVEDSDSDETGRGSDREGGRQRRSARRGTDRNVRGSASSNAFTKPADSNDQVFIQGDEIMDEIPCSQCTGQLEAGKLFKWQLDCGQGWTDIANDSILEAQYSQPFTEGIKLNNTRWGAISLDFQRMLVRHRQDLRVRRLDSPNTAYLWHLKGDEGWIQYGETDSQGRCTQMNSSTLETEFQKNPQGSYQFSFNSYTYQIVFRDMIQENLTTACRRPVRRRPVCPGTPNPAQASATLPGAQAPLTRTMSVLSLSTPSAAPKWQFSGSGGRWYDFKHRVGSNLECSTDSALIDAEYCKNPQGSMTFTVSGQSYLLDFATMTQTNTFTRTTRKVRRV